MRGILDGLGGCGCGFRVVLTIDRVARYGHSIENHGGGKTDDNESEDKDVQDET